MQEVFRVLVGPALVAAIVTYLLNTRDERKRTLRDHITEVFEEVRKDIRGAVSAGIAYFGCNDVGRLPELEAQVLLFEADVRSGMTAIREACSDAELAASPELLVIEGEFLDALTGGQFGSSGSTDPARVPLIIGTGTRLRSAIARLRRNQLSAHQNSLYRAASLLVLFLAAFAITYAAGFYVGFYL